jgi:hypothetical protein
MQPTSHSGAQQAANAPIDEHVSSADALKTTQAALDELRRENDRLRQELYRKSPNWKTKKEETERLEKEAARAKVRSGEVPVDPVTVDPIDSLLMEDTPEGARVTLWLEALEQVNWTVPEKALVRALGFAVAYHLHPTSRVSQQGNLRAFLKCKLEQAAGERVVDTGTDGNPVLTDLGDFFVKKLRETFGAAALTGYQQHDPADKRPDWEIPSASVKSAAAELFDMIAASEKPTVFNQGKALVECVNDQHGKVVLDQITSNRMISLVEEYVRPYHWGGRSARKVYSRLKKSDTEPLLEIPSEIMKLPRLMVLANAPVLIETATGHAEILGPGYHRDSGIFVIGGAVSHDIAVKDAVDGILAMVSEFSFATEPDLSRAVADKITPALVLGGTLGGRPAVDVAEADQSQSGKGYRQRIIATIYNESFANISDKSKNGGVGSLDESFDSALIKGSHFIRIDNFRGQLRSQKIESFLTEDSYSARAPWRSAQFIDPSRRLLFITSNGMEMTPDLANRSCICRIRKQPGREFRDMLGWVRDNQADALGCVLTICRHWIELGKPRTKETRHDFRPWVQSLDWIVQNMFRLPPLMDGHEALQRRVANPNLVWLREVAIALAQQNMLKQDLQATDIVRTCFQSEIKIPHVEAEDERDAARFVGRIMSSVFRSETVVVVDEFHVVRERVDATDDIHHDFNVYRFTKRG